MYPCILVPKTPSHPGCHITERSSLCYTVTWCWLSILNRAVPTTRSWRQLRNSEKPPSSHTHPLWPLQAWLGNVLWFPIPTRQSIALITPHKSPVPQCRAPWDAICMESSAVLPRTEHPSTCLHEFTVLGFLKFPPFLKAFFQPISLWTPTWSWQEASTLCRDWVVTVQPLFTLATSIPQRGQVSQLTKGIPGLSKEKMHLRTRVTT